MPRVATSPNPWPWEDFGHDILFVPEAGKAGEMLMGKRTMKEWAVIRYQDPADAKKHLGLFKEAMEYFSTEAQQFALEDSDA